MIRKQISVQIPKFNYLCDGIQLNKTMKITFYYIFNMINKIQTNKRESIYNYY